MAKHFKKITSFENLKEQYKILLKTNHPDNGGEVEKMQEINAEYDALFKIWKDRHESETGEKVTETAESTRRHFYTAYGWEGENYNPDLDIAQISKIVRAYIKEKYPTWKFSVRISRFAGGCALDCTCKESPVQMYKTADNLKIEGLTYHVSTVVEWGERKGDPLEYDTYKDEIQDTIRKLHANSYLGDSWTEEEFYAAYTKATENSNFYAIRTDVFQAVEDDIKSFINSYRYDDSDSMIDYFSTNFYVDFDFNHVKFVEKTARVADKQDKHPTTTTEATQSEETATAEEMTTDSEKDTKNSTEEATQAQEQTLTEQPTEETAETITAEPEADMFAELAKAFITGKQAPKQPHKATETEKTEETPTAEETQPKSDYNPPEPQPEKSGTGYTGEPSEVFTTAHLADLLNGKSVILGEDYERRAYIAPTPYNSARLVYSYRLGRQSAEILPGMSPEYCGCIANRNYYSAAKNADIAAELAEDVNRFIKNRIQTEEQAEQHAAEVCEPYELEKVKNAHQYAQTESARRHFYEDTAPTLNLYTRSRETKSADIVSYLTHPGETVERIASEYMQYNAEDIATAYIIYNKTVQALNEITSDPTHNAHAIKRMTKAMNAEYKTVKVTIANGETVTAESQGINALRHCGYMSSYYVASSDRQNLPQDGHRAKDIPPDDIKQITHGSRILYQAS